MMREEDASCYDLWRKYISFQNCGEKKTNGHDLNEKSMDESMIRVTPSSN